MRRTPRPGTGAAAAMVLGAILAALACARPSAKGADGPAVSAATGPASQAADTACVEALYWVEYLQAGPNAKRITDSLERAQRLGVISRAVGDVGEAAFSAALRPQLAESLRHHPAIASVKRTTAWCKRVSRLAYPSVSDGPPPDVPRSPLTLRALPEGSITDPWTSELDSVRAVVRSDEQWRWLWPSATPRYPIPSIDFSREMILVAGAGERSGHGRTIRIDSAFTARDTTFVVVREYAPGPRCVTTGMVVRPMHAVSTARSDWPVVFIERGVVARECR